MARNDPDDARQGAGDPGTGASGDAASAPRRRDRWVVVGVFLAFMLLHQTDQLLIGPLTTPIMETFGLNRAQMGAVVSWALIVGTVLYPVWGYLHDRYARARLLALAAFLWGSTTWLSAIAPTYPLFRVSRASTGIDDASYPGLYSLISDYFGPLWRGKVFGLLQISQPLGFLAAMGLALGLGPLLGWRRIFYITGSLGLLVAVVIRLFVREPPRGGGEPELAGKAEIGVVRFDRRAALGLFRKRSLLFLFAQGLFGSFPWNVIAVWFFAYLETERGYDPTAILLTMIPAVVVLAGGFVLGGALGDSLFRRTPRGRLLVSLLGISAGVVMMTLTVQVPLESRFLFAALLCLTALFIPFSSANVVATIHDITLPEVRSTALAVQYFIESGSAALAPYLAGVIADRSSLQTAIVSLSTAAWVIAAVLVAAAAYLLPADVRTLREAMGARAGGEGVG